MARPSLLPIALLTALAVALAAPAATAHTTVFSADERVRGSIGLLNEPVSTYAVTGLDVCFSQNTAAPRAPVELADPANFTVTLRAPSGERHSVAVEVPFGRPNCLTFETPLVLTEPGQYHVDLTGSINGTTFDAKDVKAGGEVVAREEITFPATVSSDEDLEARIAALEAADGDGRGIPAPAAALVFVLLAGLAAVRRLR
ncbi:MAG TPA: hypothetical protein VJ874_03030 [Candidatus Thermoplasmatota archaeon]|nr:hypothetical protein [Candidatus Thermoplasmatota archaeon]